MAVRKLDTGKWICECYHDIKMTMRYAHLAPEHLETALRFNPLATMVI